MTMSAPHKLTAASGHELPAINGNTNRQNPLRRKAARQRAQLLGICVVLAMAPSCCAHMRQERQSQEQQRRRLTTHRQTLTVHPALSHAQLEHGFGVGDANLTERGRSITRVLVAGLVSGVCSSDDWRGDLPRHIISFLPRSHGEMIYARFAEDDWYGSGAQCQECSAEGLGRRQAHGCFSAGDSGRPEPVDLLLVIGAGETFHCNSEMRLAGLDECNVTKAAHFPALVKLMGSPFVGPHTMSVHVPIRNLPMLQTNALFNFTSVVLDSSFPKPLAEDSISELHAACKAAPYTQRRGDDGPSLLYVARYNKAKGQLGFLRTVNPGTLSGYTVRFFGADLGETAIDAEMRKVAEQRGIRIEIHGPIQKHELLKEYCTAHGQVHFPVSDSNPRSPYEGLFAGLPVFVSREANLPSSAYDNEFVFSVSHFHDPEKVDETFSRFMDAVRRQPGLRSSIMATTRKWLSPRAVYSRICHEIGICASPE